MKKKEAEKVLTLLEKELKGLAKKWKIQSDWVLEIRDESKHAREPYFGVELRTDGDIYNLIYRGNSADRLKEIELRILNKAGIDPRHHWFEDAGGGILHLF